MQNLLFQIKSYIYITVHNGNQCEHWNEFLIFSQWNSNSIANLIQNQYTTLTENQKIQLISSLILWSRLVGLLKSNK